MMEFTLARVSACLCGILVIAVLFNPVVDSYDDRAEDLTEENCVSLGEMLDSFMGSQTDECVLSLNILLPDPGTRISFSGCTMTMENERGSWNYELRNPVEADSDRYGYDSYIVLKKESGTLIIHEA